MSASSNALGQIIGLTALSCLGFLSGSCSPHFDGEPERRPTYERLIAEGGMAGGFGIDDNAALHFAGSGPPRVVSSRANATAYRVECTPEGACESTLSVSVLLRLEGSGGQSAI